MNRAGPIEEFILISTHTTRRAAVYEDQRREKDETTQRVKPEGKGRRAEEGRRVQTWQCRPPEAHTWTVGALILRAGTTDLQATQRAWAGGGCVRDMTGLLRGLEVPGGV